MNDIEEELAAIREATSHLDPPANFAGRVLEVVRRPRLALAIVWASRRGLVIGALAAAATIALMLRIENGLADAMAAGALGLGP